MDKRIWLWGSAGVIVVAGVVWLRPAPLVVDTAAIERGVVRVELHGEGVTRARTGTHDEVSAPFAGGWVPEPLEAGDAVRRGQVVGRLAPLPLDPATAEAAEERVRGAEARWREHRDALARGERLFEAGALPVEQLERLRTTEVAARAEVAAARAALGRGTGVELRAPMGGRVLRHPEPHARTVAAGTLLLEIGDPGALDVLVDLRTEDAVALRPGAKAGLRPSPGADPIAATVRRIEPNAFTEVSPLGVEEQRVNVVLGFDAPPAGLGVGWRMDASLLATEAPDVPRVPIAALVREREGWGVWVVVEGRATRRAVTLGLMGAEFAEVRAGLDPGAEVILRPTDEVVEGRKVRDGDE